jgi:hypothetical protein
MLYGLCFRVVFSMKAVACWCIVWIGVFVSATVTRLSGSDQWKLGLDAPLEIDASIRAYSSGQDLVPCSLHGTDTAAHPTPHHTTTACKPRAWRWSVLEKLVLTTPVIRSLFSCYHVIVGAICDMDRLVSGYI